MIVFRLNTDSIDVRQFVIALAIVGIVLLSIGVVVDGVAADETSANDDDDENETASSVVAQLDDDIRVVDYHYSDATEEMTIELEHTAESDRRAQITATEVVTHREGSAGTFGVDTARMQPEETIELRLDVERVDGIAAVMIVSDESIEEGTGVFVRDEEDTATSVLDGPATWNLIRLAGLSGALGAGMITVGIGWHRISKRRGEIRDAFR